MNYKEGVLTHDEGCQCCDNSCIDHGESCLLLGATEVQVILGWEMHRLIFSLLFSYVILIMRHKQPSL